MRKRLRKKLKLKEFQEFGFNVSFDGPTVELAEGFLDRFIAYIESVDLCIGGGWRNGRASFYVTNNPRIKYVSEMDRVYVESFLTGERGISNINVAPLTDAWYGPFDN